MKSKGFTLIELLVVIAIIGILASIVLVSFPGAQKKAKDSRVVSAISQMRTVMAYVEANTGSYSTFACVLGAAGDPCTSCSEADLLSLCTEAKTNGAAGPTLVNCADCGASSQPAACVYSQLNQKTNYWYCADSTGKAGFTSTDPSTACAATANASCPAVTG